MRKILIIFVLGLAASCSGAPERYETVQAIDEYGCPAWKIVIIEDDRIYCIDPTVLERQQAMIEDVERR